MALVTYSKLINLLQTIGAIFLPFDLVIFSMSCPHGAKTDQLSCDVSETPLQTSGALFPKTTIGK